MKFPSFKSLSSGFCNFWGTKFKKPSKSRNLFAIPFLRVLKKESSPLSLPQKRQKESIPRVRVLGLDPSLLLGLNLSSMCFNSNCVALVMG